MTIAKNVATTTSDAVRARRGRDERGDRGLVVDRGAEIAVGEAVEVVPELAPDRLVQAELATKRRNAAGVCVQAEQGTRPGRRG